ncbi:MAG: acetyl-CoA acetyltransferase [bacterium]|nr:acetyl-CoA acetyltransferase [bacterium]
MPVSERPVIVGVGQLVQRDAELDDALEPLKMLEQVTRQAAQDAGITDATLASLDTVAVVSVAGWRATNPARLLSDVIGAKPSTEFTTELGGQIGITAANLLAERITRGETKIGLLAGCNNLRTLRRAIAIKRDLGWAKGGGPAPECIGEVRPGNSDLERQYGMDMPSDIYPIFENALRARRGLSLDEHAQKVGKLFSAFTKVAAANPYAWFPTFRDAAELTTPTAQNRMIAFPYPKYLNAILNTDQAAALLIMSESAALEAGVPREKLVYWWGGAESVEKAWNSSERPDFASCPAMLDASESALQNAGIQISDVDLIDFYSCFPVAVETAIRQLGLSEDDPRGFTVTGGLPYAGGPASAYTLHSLATMAECVRGGSDKVGLVTGNGWYLTKHAASLWASSPKPGSAPTRGLCDDLPSAKLNCTPRPVVPDVHGDAVVEAYTVLYGKDGSPERGIVLGTAEGGARFLANTPADRGLLEDFVSSEQVGRRGILKDVAGLQQFDPA